MEQRWQDLASLLSLPSGDPSSPHTAHHPHVHHPHHHQSPPIMAPHATSPPHTPGHAPSIHHPHALYPTHDNSTVGASGAGAGVPRGVLLHNATLPPPMPDPMTHNLTYSNSMGEYLYELYIIFILI